ncbi:MAG TPA: hypothetical protein VLW52_14535 [Opitutaceae bacterium]|nr:hypothetical protein [Opitutaceae bacterium]
MKHRMGLSLVVAVAFGWASQAMRGAVPGSLHAEPIPLSDQKIASVTVSPDGEHIAFVAPKGSRFVAVIDGQPGDRFDGIGNSNLSAEANAFTFAAVGGHYRYLGRSGEQFHVVIDGQSLPGYDIFSQTCFSPDGKQCAFVGENNVHSDYHVVVNGVPSPSYRSEIKGLQFSAAGHVAYVADTTDKTTNGYRRFVVLDGKPEAPFADILNFQFSADGRHWAYAGRDNAIPLHYGDPKPPEKSHLMVDGKELGTFESVLKVLLSADGRHIAYLASTGTGMVVGLDLQTWPCLATNGSAIMTATSSLTMSADGKKVAWIQQGQYSAQVFVNGKAGASYDSIQQLSFSPDGQHLYCFGFKRTAQGESIFVAADDDEWGPYSRTVNGAEVAAFRFVFSPDGKHVAFESGDGKNCFVVRDGKSGAPYDHVYGTITFSPDSQHIAYFADKDRLKNLSPLVRQQAAQSPDFDPGNYLVIDTTEQRLPRGTSYGQNGVAQTTFFFSPDSQHTAYIAGNDKVVVDGRLVPVSQGSAVNLWEQYKSASPVTFSPGSDHILFAASGYGSGPGPELYVDGDKLPGYSLLAPPVFLKRDTVMFFGKNASTGAIDRVSLALGPDRAFGAVDGAAAAPGLAGPSANPAGPATGSPPGAAAGAPSMGTPPGAGVPNLAAAMAGAQSMGAPPGAGVPNLASAMAGAPGGSAMPGLASALSGSQSGSAMPALAGALAGALPNGVGSQAATVASEAAPMIQQAFNPGTKVEVTMVDAVDSTRDPFGKQYRATVAQKVTAGDGTVISQGAAAIVTVVQDGSGAAAHLAAVTINGQPVPVNGSSASVVSGVKKVAKVASSLLGVFGSRASALASAASTASALTAATGERVVLPQGTKVTFTLE